MTYLCDVYTDEDEYEVFLEDMLLHEGHFLSYSLNGQPREFVFGTLNKGWIPNENDIIRLCGIKNGEIRFSWKDERQMFSYLVEWSNEDSDSRFRYFEYLSDAEKFVRILSEEDENKKIKLMEVY